jgi:hypothetical protein
MDIALVRAALGDRAGAMRALEEAYRRRDPWLVWVGTPVYAGLRGEVRYGELLRRMGLGVYPAVATSIKH